MTRNSIHNTDSYNTGKSRQTRELLNQDLATRHYRVKSRSGNSPQHTYGSCSTETRGSIQEKLRLP